MGATVMMYSLIRDHLQEARKKVREQQKEDNWCGTLDINTHLHPIPALNL